MLPIFKCSFPKMVRARQAFDSPRIEDVKAAVREEFARIELGSLVLPDMRIAITAGSRGIANIASILKVVVEEVRGAGADPFIVPAMGSHGGAAADGQLALLYALGITEETTGAPIISSMDTVQIAETPSGIPVYMDKNAAGADALIIVNRIKPHTTFEGDIESGLYKMMAVGLSKHQGALTAHHVFFDHGYSNTIKEIGKAVLQTGRVAAGLGIIENVYEETAEIIACRPEEFDIVEKSALERAKQLVGRLPFDELDVLIVDEIGKDISGTGMDCKVIGRIYNQASQNPDNPRIKRIIARDLTPGSEGSAYGIGMADFTTRRLFEKTDLQKVYVNSLTAQCPENGRMPVICENDEESLSYALFTIGGVDPAQARVMRIQNTLHLEDILISESLLPEAQSNRHLKIIGELEEIELDENRNFCKPSI